MRRLAMLLSLALLCGCENDTSNDLAGLGDGDNADKTCLGCHSSETRLKEALGVKADLALKDGPGGQVDELEDWEKVIITGANGDQFLASPHGPNYRR